MFDIVLEPALCVLRKRTYCSGEHFVSSVTFSLDIVVVDEVIKVVISVVAATCVVVVSFAVIVVLVDGFVDVFPLASSVLISKKAKKKVVNTISTTLKFPPPPPPQGLACRVIFR